MPKRPKHDNFVVEFEFKQLESENWTITYDSKGLGKGAGDIFGAARSRHPKQRH